MNPFWCSMDVNKVPCIAKLQRSLKIATSYYIDFGKDLQRNKA